jgi:hypothetical protein
VDGSLVGVAGAADVIIRHGNQLTDRGIVCGPAQSMDDIIDGQLTTSAPKQPEHDLLELLGNRR